MTVDNLVTAAIWKDPGDGSVILMKNLSWELLVQIIRYFASLHRAILIIMLPHQNEGWKRCTFPVIIGFYIVCHTLIDK